MARRGRPVGSRAAVSRPHQVAVRLTEDERGWLLAEAGRRGESESVVLRQLLDDARRREMDDLAECLYCGADTKERDPVPSVGDDEAWGRLAAEHRAGCEWIQTRAHRRDPDLESGADGRAGSMPDTTNKILVQAIAERERQYRDAIDRVRMNIENDPEAWDATTLLREAIGIIGCLRRLLPDVSVDAVYRAFGAPGDFGYETTIGDALYRLYRGKAG